VRILALVALLLAAFAARVSGDSLALQVVLRGKINDSHPSNTPESFDPPAFDGATLLVPRVRSSGNLNPSHTTDFLRLAPGGEPHTIATSHEETGGSNLTLGWSPSIGDGLAAFTRYGSGAYALSELLGVFAVPPGSDTMTQLAGGDVPWPMAAPEHASFDRASTWNGRVVFAAAHFDEALDPTMHVFLHEDASGLVELAGPDLPGFADLVNLSEPTLAMDACTFTSYRDGVGAAIHRRAVGTDGALGPIETWATTGDPVPQGGGSFDGFASLQIDRARGDAACFLDWRVDALGPGVYVASAAGVSLVADTATPIPGGDGAFEWFEWACSIDDGVVAFVGTGSDGQEGVYRKRPGEPLEKVLAVGDFADGGEVTNVLFGPEALAMGRIAFAAWIDIGADIFGRNVRSVVFVPEPDASALGSIALLALLVRRRFGADFPAQSSASPINARDCSSAESKNDVADAACTDSES